MRGFLLIKKLMRFVRRKRVTLTLLRTSMSYPTSSLPRRSARIAAKSKMEPLPSTMKASPSTMERDMADYTRLIGELRRAAIVVEGKSNMMEVTEAMRTLMNFLLWRDELLDSLDDTAIQYLHAWMMNFRTAHDKWNQEFAKNMKEAVRFNKGFFINMEPNSSTPGDVMRVLRLEAEKHNRITSAQIEIDVVYDHLRRRL